MEMKLRNKFNGSAFALCTLVLGWLPFVPQASYAVTGNTQAAACSPLPTMQKFIQLSRVERLSDSQYRVAWPLEVEDEVSTQLQPETGGEFFIVRCLPPGQWAVVGRGTVENLNGQFVVASATKPIEVAENVGNQFQKPMVGDVVLPQHQSTEPIARIQPKFEFSLEELFERDVVQTLSYNLSEEGKDILRNSFSKFGNASGRVLVEGFMNTTGGREFLRMESQIRATTVAQFLTREFGIEESRISAIGLGSAGLARGMTPLPRWPQKEVLEGVVLRVIPR